GGVRAQAAVWADDGPGARGHLHGGHGAVGPPRPARELMGTLGARLAQILFAGVRRPRRELVWLIARRDLRESTSDARLFIAMTSLTFVIPLLATFGVSLATPLLGTAELAGSRKLIE